MTVYPRRMEKNVIAKGEKRTEQVVLGAELEKEMSDEAKLPDRIWSLKFKIDGEDVTFLCVLQTTGWKPKLGDKVTLYRQPFSVDDRRIFATLEKQA